ncbi:uncharacterized protein LOC135828132 [Sycon ciliatum]|uniref:uncharacterized protein LOC135828132 n=1 Tax=Sycon ciliatum TaxID=27933 RepID=UPI0031F65D66
MEPVDPPPRIGPDEASRSGKRLLPKAVEKYRDRLRAVYKNFQYPLEACKGNEERTLDLEEVFADLHIVPKQKLNARMEDVDRLGTSAGMEDLAHSFSPGAKKLRKIRLAQLLTLKRSQRQRMYKNTFRVMVLSCAGGGKTMLMVKKAPYEWALGRMWDEIDVLCALELRLSSVRNAQCIGDLLNLQNRGITLPVDQAEVIDYICDHPQRVCIVLDGLDEVSLDDCSDFINNLIRGTELPGVRLILTSRHSAEAMRLMHTLPFQRRVELLGFDDDNLGRYVHNILKAEEATGLLEKISSNPQLGAMMRTPFLAEGVCKLYRCNKTVPDTLGPLFNSLILNVLQQQQQQKAIKDQQQYGNWGSVPDHIKDVVAELGCFAFQMLIRKRVVFTEDDFTMFQVSSAARSLGFLVACDKAVHDTGDQWRFSHLSMQEAIAAHFYARTCKPTAADVRQLVNYIGSMPGALSTFGIFLATELDSECVEALLHSILFGKPMAMTGAEDHRIVHFLCVIRDDMMLWADHLASVFQLEDAETLAEELLSGKIGMASSASEVVKAAMDPAVKVTSKEFLRTLLSLWLRHTPSANTQMLYDYICRFAQGLAVRCFSATPQCQTDPGTSSSTAMLSAATNSSSPSQLNTTESRGYRLVFACRVFSAHASTDHFQGKSIPSLEQVLQESGLDFDNVLLTAADCQSVSTVMHHYHQCITRVSLKDCAIGDDVYQCLSAGLTLLNNVTDIDLQDNLLTDRHAGHIASLIKTNASSLGKLFTDGNAFTSLGNVELHHYTHTCTGLQLLSIGGQGSTDESINLSVLSKILGECTLLYVIGLVDYRIGDAGLAQIAPLLTTTSRVVLALAKVGISESSTMVLSNILHKHCDTLQMLALSGSHLTDGCLKVISNPLRNCSKLQHLYLDDCNLSTSSLPVLASLLRSCKALSELHVTGNDFQDAKAIAEPFARSVESCTSLNRLVMPEMQLLDPRLHQELVSLNKPGLAVQFEKCIDYPEPKHDSEGVYNPDEDSDDDDD